MPSEALECEAGILLVQKMGGGMGISISLVALVISIASLAWNVANTPRPCFRFEKISEKSEPSHPDERYFLIRAVNCGNGSAYDARAKTSPVSSPWFDLFGEESPVVDEKDELKPGDALVFWAKAGHTEYVVSDKSVWETVDDPTVAIVLTWKRPPFFKWKHKLTTTTAECERRGSWRWRESRA
jgi:hypothetical protein